MSNGSRNDIINLNNARGEVLARIFLIPGRAAFVLMLLLLPALVAGAVINVGPGESVQAAIDAAVPGDVIAVAAGEFNEDIDFKGKDVQVVGSGPASVLRGTGGGPVVTFAGGETPAALLDSFTITGGLAVDGGGIYVADSSPTILRDLIVENRAASRGSGVYLLRSMAELRNNLVIYNRTGGGDPHSVQIREGAPVLINNTIARGDSNGILISGASAAVVMNNLIARNGAVIDGERRGRGICDFSGGLARIHHNLFHRNRVAALLTGGTDYKRVESAQNEIGPDRLVGNLDGRPGFIGRLPRLSVGVTPDAFVPRPDPRRSAGRDAGNPDPAFSDPDGSRNDIGFTGGPYAWGE